MAAEVLTCGRPPAPTEAIVPYGFGVCGVQCAGQDPGHLLPPTPLPFAVYVGYRPSESKSGLVRLYWLDQSALAGWAVNHHCHNCAFYSCFVISTSMRARILASFPLVQAQLLDLGLVPSRYLVTIC